MKMVTVFVLALCSLVAFADDEKQPCPEIKGSLLQKNVKVLQRVEASQVLEKQEKRGVVARYKTIYNFVNFKVNLGHISYLGKYAENESGERVFITDLDHDTITTDGTVYHFREYGDYFLYVWPIGVQQFTSSTGKDVRLKKFTVNPKVFLEYQRRKNK